MYDFKKHIEYHIKKVMGSLVNDHEARDLAIGLEKLIGMQPQLPNPNETAAVAVKRPKTAALCYDRVHCFDPRMVPVGIRFGYTTDLEVEFMVRMLMSFTLSDRISKSSGKHVSGEVSEIYKEMLKVLYENTKWLIGREPMVKDMTPVQLFNDSVTQFNRKISEEMLHHHSINVIPIFHTAAACHQDYKPGNIEVIAYSLANLGIVDEESLTWDQVIQFREDKESRRKYRCLVHWMDKEMIGKNFTFVQDEISEKLYDYEQVLKKHGIKGTLGTIYAILDPRTWATGFTFGSEFVSKGDLGLGALCGSAVIAGSVLIDIVKSRLDVEGPSRNEIAWVYEVKQASEAGKKLQ